MPGIPTFPDNLRFPVDSDSPDIPRDFKNLANDTQAALVKRDAVIAAGDEAFAAYTPIDNKPGYVLITTVRQVTVTVVGRLGPMDLSENGKYVGSCPYVSCQPYETSSRFTFAVINADIVNVHFAVYLNDTPAPVGTIVLASILAITPKN